jgi:DNA-binding beta-propeller fold protein YncE
MRIATPRSARGARLALLVAVAMSLPLLVPVVASAAPGDLTYLTCLSDRGVHGCDDPMREILGGDPLRGADDMATYGDDVYLLNSTSTQSAIAHLSRDLDGTLTLEDCIAQEGSFGCVEPTHESIQGPNDIAVSADGESVYVAAGGGGVVEGAITAFERAPDGSLAFQECWANGGAHGCEESAKDSLHPLYSVAVSPDGASVYTGGVGPSGAISTFDRAGDGSLSYDDCIANLGFAECDEPPEDKDALGFPLQIAVSPDGENVYVAASEDHAVVWFERSTATGEIAFMDCIANGGSKDCQNPPFDGLGSARSVVVSPDGETVYASTRSSRWNAAPSTAR